MVKMTIVESDDGTEAGNHETAIPIPADAAAKSTENAKESDKGNQSALRNQLSQNIEAGNHEIAISVPADGNHEIAISVSADAASTPTQTDPELPENADSHDHHQQMCEAIIQSDWAAAEKLLESHRSLASEEISENGETALHLAVRTRLEDITPAVWKKESARFQAAPARLLPTVPAYRRIRTAVQMREAAPPPALQTRQSSPPPAVQTREASISEAVRRRQTEFIHKLTNYVKTFDCICLLDGQGCTACHYAVEAGNLELVRIMMEADPAVVSAKNRDGETPLDLALSKEKTEIILYFLSVASIDYRKLKRCLDHFLSVIEKRRFDTALQILEKNETLALRKDQENRTALHVLAQVDMSKGWKIRHLGKLQTDFDLLAERIWEILIARLKCNRLLMLVESAPSLVVEDKGLVKRYSILQDAAYVGNLKLINIITDDFPHLLSHIVGDEGCSLLHILVMYRRENLVELIEKAKHVEDDSVISLDKDGNNILHAAAKSRYPEGLEVVADQDLELQRAYGWFKAVEKQGPSIYREMRNKKGYRPIELFWKEHGKMLATSEAYQKKTAESCMLISTIVLTLVFAAAFAPPGGFNQDTGIPILLKNNKWFTSFIVFELLALCFSTLSIIGFWSIITSKTQEYQFFVWPRYLRFSMCALLLSVFFVISAFLSAFLLVFVEERKALYFILPLYALFFFVIFYQVYKVLPKTNSHSLMDPSTNNLNNPRRRVYRFGASQLKKEEVIYSYVKP